MKICSYEKHVASSKSIKLLMFSIGFQSLNILLLPNIELQDIEKSWKDLEQAEKDFQDWILAELRK